MREVLGWRRATTVLRTGLLGASTWRFGVALSRTSGPSRSWWTSLNVFFEVVLTTSTWSGDSSQFVFSAQAAVKRKLFEELCSLL